MAIDHLITDKEAFSVNLKSMLISRDRRVIPREGLKPSAVLIPLCYKQDEPFVILTKRSMNVEYHKGEISFPGGTFEEKDESMEMTALREAHEEIGLKPEAVNVLGLLDDYITLLGFHITPVVAMVPYPYEFRINSEAQSLLWVSLQKTLKDDVWMAQRRPWGEKGMNVYFLKAEGGVVWGATARILKRLADLIAGRKIPFGPVSQEAMDWVQKVMASQGTYPVYGLPRNDNDKE